MKILVFIQDNVDIVRTFNMIMFKVFCDSFKSLYSVLSSDLLFCIALEAFNTKCDLNQMLDIWPGMDCISRASSIVCGM